MRSLEEIMEGEILDFQEIESQFFLLRLISVFENRYQVKADNFFKEISWKQFFAIICINHCKESPTIKELAEIMGSSHQNVKQILNKLEDKGYVKTVLDEHDKRKQRITVTEKTIAFCEKHNKRSQTIVKKIFEGIDEKNIGTVIKTLLQMEKNLEDIN